MTAPREGRRAGRALVVVATTAVVLLASGCSGRVHKVVTTNTVDVTTTQTLTSPAPVQSSYTPPPATAVAPLGSAHAPMPAGETEGPCPYIANDVVANTEGDHVYRSSVITTTTPHGCRFYFYASPFQAIADIVPVTFDSPTAARNAMIATGNAGANVFGAPALAPGVDGVLYQTAFNPQDGMRDWACTFAKGNVMVTVHTQQTNTSQDAKNLALLLIPKF
ncbi:MAG: hypothetical protein JO147_14290 [Actinobacteria bacterium]|nr:hypothetical protein [Actinomycetota bacterium]